MLKIFCELKSGEKILCFHWEGSAESGIERAKRDARLHGFEAIKFWAEA